MDPTAPLTPRVVGVNWPKPERPHNEPTEPHKQATSARDRLIIHLLDAQTAYAKARSFLNKLHSIKEDAEFSRRKLPDGFGRLEETVYDMIGSIGWCHEEVDQAMVEKLGRPLRGIPAIDGRQLRDRIKQVQGEVEEYDSEVGLLSKNVSEAVEGLKKDKKAGSSKEK
ncbi:MAG: hypothetical protein M1831_005486 [Alyxoria varia]|nr:MAG: hypothetical protein M1831_005486 [Alyxoria varia]